MDYNYANSLHPGSTLVKKQCSVKLKNQEIQGCYEYILFHPKNEYPKYHKVDQQKTNCIY